VILKERRQGQAQKFHATARSSKLYIPLGLMILKMSLHQELSSIKAILLSENDDFLKGQNFGFIGC